VPVTGGLVLVLELVLRKFRGQIATKPRRARPKGVPVSSANPAG
jgi:hypothetical protein